MRSVNPRIPNINIQETISKNLYGTERFTLIFKEIHLKLFNTLKFNQPHWRRYESMYIFIIILVKYSIDLDYFTIQLQNKENLLLFF